MSQYSLLHAAKKNCGDFLIRDAALALIRHHTNVSDDEVLTVDVVGRNLDQETIDSVAETDVAFLAGGPGYQPEFYPGVYPALDDLLDVVDVVPMGPGWRGIDEETYSFTDESVRVLERIVGQDRVPFLGARDLPTVRILRNYGLPAELTGCPAWYYYDGYPPEAEFSPSQSIDHIIVSTPPQNSNRYLLQYFQLLRTLNELFPGATIVCSFHRGKFKESLEPYVGYPWERATYVRNTASLIYGLINSYARRNGFELYDASGSSEYVQRYYNADLHVGHRVHGHIPALAGGTPSFLIQIDGRGFGVSESLGTSGDVSGRSSIRGPVQEVKSSIEYNIRNNYPDFETVDQNRLQAYEKMTELLQSAL
ncbi:polysaccharide pyruvyl transferase family protein [haloarchaeon 3A1-DGR]|nr:polysaccharide pyruvyl transferase family protein [haloarchaeon 3A1-DGR]